MKQEIDLDALDAELTQVSDDLASRRSFDDLTPVMRRALRRPYAHLAVVIAIGALAIGIGWWKSMDGLLAAGVAWVAIMLPGRIRDAYRRSGSAPRMEKSLFEECAATAQRRFALDVIYLVLCIPLLVALLVLGWTLRDSTWAWWAAGAVFLSVPYHLVVRIPRSAAEQQETLRWAREDRKTQVAGPPELDDEVDDDEEEEDDDRLLLVVITKGLVGVFFAFVAPLLTLALIALAVVGPDRTRPAIAAAVLIAGQAIFGRRIKAFLRGIEGRVGGDGEDPAVEEDR